MVNFIINFLTSFLLGLLTPLTALCVLPIYPAFLAYLANKLSSETKKRNLISLSLIVVSGIIIFMLLLGLIFTTFLQFSLTNIIGVVSPIAFGILLIISIFLMFDINFSKVLPKFSTPTFKNPLINAFIFGFFFGAIIIPCNPAFIAAFFARSLLIKNFFLNMFNFLSFGIGIGFPLLIFSVLSDRFEEKVINFLTLNKRKINILAGIIMFVVSLYYLIIVFNVLRIF